MLIKVQLYENQGKFTQCIGNSMYQGPEAKEELNTFSELSEGNFD